MSKLLVDTDAFCKLGVAGLLANAANVFDASLPECARLPALPHMLRRGALRNHYGAKHCDTLAQLVNETPVMGNPSVDWLDKLTQVEAIDPGEAQIFAMSAEQGTTIISSDKRALRALKDVEGYSEVLANRIAVLEAVLIALCHRLGPESVRRSVAPLLPYDKMVRVCFSDDNSDPIGALYSYYGALAAEVEPIALWDPKVVGG